MSGFRHRRSVAGLLSVVTLAVCAVVAAPAEGASGPGSAASGSAAAAVSPPSIFGCDEPAGDPDPRSDPIAWTQRDLENIECATERQQDEVDNPAFLRKWAQEDARSLGLLPGFVADQLANPTRPHISATHWLAPAKVGDPFRVPEEWAASGRGRQQRFTFVASTGAQLTARLFTPRVIKPGERLPGLTMSPGLQSYNEVNAWFAEGMAEAGYMVLVIDPQGQGDSENLPHKPDGSIDCSPAGCPDVPTSDKPDTQSAVDFLLSTPSAPFPYAPDAKGAYPANARGALHYNPLWAHLDRSRIGIAGHSLGAMAVTSVGQSDPRVKAVVSYDNLDGSVAPWAAGHIHAPTLFFSVDYAFPSVLAPMNPLDPPNPDQHLLAAYRQLQHAGVDTMNVTTRASTHYEFGYQPFPASLQASRYGERVAFYYSLAWFDWYLRGDPSGLRRLTARQYDGSSDAHSIGAGTYEDGQNVPYRIAGKCVSNLLSFYFHSAYWLDGGQITSGDLRARGCP
ncbi:MAG TPA: hypothetical protein VHA73_07695 [Acidimicrobiales bacterium]|jgi:dienelactone hydrolase|nr:hypothetical protein [Acidimicrobiales bacterium]